jgi:hypothetical protein
MRLFQLRSIVVSAAICLLAGSAGATAIHGQFVGTDFTFGTFGPSGQLVQETSNPGDPEPLFGAPVVSGNVLLFSPTAFTANATGAGGFVDTGSQLQFELIGNTSSDFIDKITIQEFGDVVFAGVPTATAATGTFINMTLFVTVMEVNGSAIAPITGSVAGSFTVGPSFDAVTQGQNTTTLWQGTAFFDVDAFLAANSIVGSATKVRVALDNDLFAFSEAGTSSKVQKKVANGIVVTIPEPSALALLALVCLSLGLRARRS